MPRKSVLVYPGHFHAKLLSLARKYSRSPKPYPKGLDCGVEGVCSGYHAGPTMPVCPDPQDADLLFGKL